MLSLLHHQLQIHVFTELIFHTDSELIATGRTIDEIREAIGADS